MTELEGKRTTVMIRRHVAIRIYKPEVATHFLSPQTSWAYCMNNRHTLWFCPYMYCPVHDYRYGLPQRTSSPTLWSVWAEAEQVQGKEKNQLCLQNIFSWAENSFWHWHIWGWCQYTRWEMFCMKCKLSMERTICAITQGVHHKCIVMPFEWQPHTAE